MGTHATLERSKAHLFQKIDFVNILVIFNTFIWEKKRFHSEKHLYCEEKEHFSNFPLVGLNL